MAMKTNSSLITLFLPSINQHRKPKILKNEDTNSHSLDVLSDTSEITWMSSQIQIKEMNSVLHNDFMGDAEFVLSLKVLI